ncbi:uncharacterized protein LOC125655975 [Ostrea edulis]|uniref:uncharacterized protein LOC125655975 n=1 Tax=Ostrea edulis TaxID=37623 RepID=UPI0024AF65B8|nr:uncharacterized protein LOC125655975 [Ostrea edulis]
MELSWASVSSMGKIPQPRAFSAFRACGVWQAIRDVFPRVTIKGCVFHWTKAVWTHVQQLGFVATFTERESTHTFIKQLMALPFLPWNHIPDVFAAMRSRCPHSLQELMNYIDNQWMQNPVFPIRTWSVYAFSVRTNNDVEGWHRRMKVEAQGLALPLYQIIPLLRREAELIRTRIAAVDLERNTRKATNRTQKRIEEASELYMQQRITVSHFWKIYGDLYSGVYDLHL